MNKSEIRVDYAVRHVIAENSSADGSSHRVRQQRQRPKSAIAEGSGSARRRNELLAATIRDEFVHKKSNNSSNGADRRDNTSSQRASQTMKGNTTNTVSVGDLLQQQSRRVEFTGPTAQTMCDSTMGSATMGASYCGMGVSLPTTIRRPVSAPKRRPPMLVEPEEELPLWRSRGKTDMADTLLQQDNKVSLFRKKEWPTNPKPPIPTENVLGLSNSTSRKTIKSSHSRDRIPKTNGPIANCTPYKMPEHHYPPVIHRDETPSLRNRSNWSCQTTYLDAEERAKPQGKPDLSPATFHATYRIPPQLDRDYVEVTRSLDTISAAYPRGRF